MITLYHFFCTRVEERVAHDFVIGFKKRLLSLIHYLRPKLLFFIVIKNSTKLVV